MGWKLQNEMKSNVLVVGSVESEFIIVRRFVASDRSAQIRLHQKEILYFVRAYRTGLYARRMYYVDITFCQMV